MTDSVYLVTTGEYDDYRIDTVFATQELAEQYVALMHGDSEEYSVREWKVLYEVPLIHTELQLNAHLPEGAITPSDITQKITEQELPHIISDSCKNLLLQDTVFLRYRKEVVIVARGCDHEQVRQAFQDRLDAKVREAFD